MDAHLQIFWEIKRGSYELLLQEKQTRNGGRREYFFNDYIGS
jgi:hypothetical protein